MKKFKIAFIAGTRPNFIKIAPLLAEADRNPKLRNVFIHSGQHYDTLMSDVFLKELGIRKPDHHIDSGSGSHAEQTAKIMLGLEEAFKKINPDLVVVVGDVNTTMAASLVSSKMLIKIAHVEAGLRSFDRTMPEEINRLVTDQLSDFLFTTSPDSHINLENEGISKHKIFFTGNVMIDSLVKTMELKKIKVKPSSPPYCYLTLHRPSNVDDENTLRKILNTLAEISKKIKIVFPAHPRTIANIKKFKLTSLVKGSNIELKKPVGYIESVKLIAGATLVITDSGGLQEETTFMKIPCFTLRKNTERPITVEIGTNTIIGDDYTLLTKKFAEIMNGQYKTGKIPKYWDGKSAQRIINVIADKL